MASSKLRVVIRDRPSGVQTQLEGGVAWLVPLLGCGGEDRVETYELDCFLSGPPPGHCP